MRIGILSPSIYMSPTRYKDMIFAPRELSVVLADGLVERGHTVYFFTAPDIKTKAKLIPGDAKLLTGEYIVDKMKNVDTARFKWASFYGLKRDYELDLTSRCFKMAIDHKLDIIHSYHDTMSHFFDDLTNFPTVYTLHDPLPTNEKSLFYWLLKRFAKHRFISISNAYRHHPGLRLNFVGTVYHGLDLSEYPYSGKGGSYLSFIGRLAPEKGLDGAIKAAIVVNKPIHVATSSMAQNKNTPYFDEKIVPFVGHSGVKFTGFMSGSDKSKFLENSVALLFPIQWEEPFGLVMVEAMACGTPVIAYDRGSVSEIVRDGVTGFIVPPEKGVDGLVEAIKKIDQIDRKACRKHVEEHFTVEKMVEGYERVYQKVLHN